MRQTPSRATLSKNGFFTAAAPLCILGPDVTNERRSARSWPWWAALAASVVVAFLPALRCQFVNWDDDINFLDNPDYRGLSPTHLKWMFRTFLMGHYQPLSWVTLGLDYVVWGMNPFGYHLTSLLLHALGVCVFFEVLRTLFGLVAGLQGVDEKAKLRAAFIGALFFGIHPLRVESVVWITERRDVLCGVFFLLSILMYLRMHERASAGLPWKKAYWLSVVFFACSLLSKALGIALPAVLLVLDAWPLRRLETGQRAATLSRKVPYVLVALLDGLVMLLAMRQLGTVRSIHQYDFFERALQAAYGVCFYVGKSLLPFGLAPLYPSDVSSGPTRVATVASLVGIVGVTALLILRWKRWPALLTGWVSYILLVSPVLGLVVTGRQVAADRYTYLACLPFAALLGGAFARLRPEQARRLGPALAGVFVLCGILTLRQAGVWENGGTLWSRQIRIFPDNAEGYYYRGLFLEAGKQRADALRDYDKMLQLAPEFASGYFTRGALRAELGDWSGAVADYSEHLKRAPNSEKARYHRGLAFMALGNAAAARADFTEALVMNPTRVDAWVQRARAQVRLGRQDAALDDYAEAIRLAPAGGDTLESVRKLLEEARGNK